MKFRIVEQSKRVYAVEYDDKTADGLRLPELIDFCKRLGSKVPELKTVILQATAFVIAVDRM